MSAVFGGVAGPGRNSTDQGLSLSVMETFRLAWQDEDLRGRILFILTIFAVFATGVHIPVPIPGHTSVELNDLVNNNSYFQLLNALGGGAFRRLSVLALGLNPYITAAIIMQIFYQVTPAWKEELKEGGEYARKLQNQRTRLLSIVLCLASAVGYISAISGALSKSGTPLTPFDEGIIILFWTAGAMFTLWLGEQISERGIGNGVSLMIFAGIIIGFPSTASTVWSQAQVDGFPGGLIKLGLLILVFIITTYYVVYFTVAQRQIAIQHMKRTQGTRTLGGNTSYLPFSVSMVGVIPLIFAIALIFMPAQFSAMFPVGSTPQIVLQFVGQLLYPSVSHGWKGIAACFVFSALIFFFTYFYTAIQYNVDDIADNLKRSGSFIPGIRPGKQTADFLNNSLSKITFIGAIFLAVVALLQFIAPDMFGFPRVSIIGGSTLLILVQVALETMRQIEANILMKKYNS